MKLSVTKDDIRPKFGYWINVFEVILSLKVPLKYIDYRLPLYFPKLKEWTEITTASGIVEKWTKWFNEDTIGASKSILKHSLVLEPHPAGIQEIHEAEHKVFLKKNKRIIDTMLKYLDDKDLKLE